MYRFSEASLSELNTLDKRLRAVCFEAIKYFDFKVLEGYRGEEEQNRVYREGKSKLQFPHSKHNSRPSKAVDIVPYPIDWNDRERFFYLAGIMEVCAAQLGVKIRWGGDWNGDDNFKDGWDLPHFELVD